MASAPLWLWLSALTCYAEQWVHFLAHTVLSQTMGEKRGVDSLLLALSGTETKSLLVVGVASRTFSGTFESFH
jgi:hypothetical protein